MNDTTRISDLPPEETSITFQATPGTWERFSLELKSIAGNFYDHRDSTFRVPIGRSLLKRLELDRYELSLTKVVRVPRFMEGYRLEFDTVGMLISYYHGTSPYQGYLRYYINKSTFSITSDYLHVTELPRVVPAFTGIPSKFWTWKQGTYTAAPRDLGIPWLSDISNLLLETVVPVSQLHRLMEDFDVTPDSPDFFLEDAESEGLLRVRTGLGNLQVGKGAALLRNYAHGNTAGTTLLHRKSTGEILWKTDGLRLMIDDLFSVWNLGGL